MTSTPTMTQTQFVWVNDNGYEDSATFYTEGSIETFDLYGGNLKKRLRFALDCTGADYTSGYSLHVQRNGTGGYTRITTGTSYVRNAASAETSWTYTDDSATTDRMTAGTGTFNAGKIDTNGSTTSWTTTKNQNTQVEFCLEFVSADLSDGNYLEFRVYTAADVALNGGYTNTARMNVTKNAPDMTPKRNSIIKSKIFHSKIIR